MAHAAMIDEHLVGGNERRMFLVRPRGALWEMCCGGGKDSIAYPSLTEARAAAFGGAMKHWEKHRGPSGVQVEGQAGMAGMFGRVG
jgi:hypothetical protein